jgi:acetyl esterase/lipase
VSHADQLPLWPGRPPSSDPGDAFQPWLDPYVAASGPRRGAVLVCPGGGYGGRAPHEGAPVAARLNDAGLHAFVLQYRVTPHRHPAPLLDAARAVRLIRQHASEWGVDPGRVAACGFSAGGHLAASLGVHYGRVPSYDDLDRVPCRPDALVLCYPVISTGPYRHQGSFDNLLGPAAPDALRNEMSLELQVTTETPPTFLWHTAADAGVPVENSLLFASALRQNDVPFELHVYPRGAHGLGLAPEDPHVGTWIDLCCQWLRNMGW